MISLQNDLSPELPNNVSSSSHEPHSVTRYQPPRKLQNSNLYYSSSRDIPFGYEEIGDEEEEDTMPSHIYTLIQGPGCIHSYENLKGTAGSQQSKNSETPLPKVPAYTSHLPTAPEGNEPSLPRARLVTPSQSQIHSVNENRSNSPLFIQDSIEELGYSTVRHERVKIAVDNRKFVSDACRKILDKFRFRPQMISPENGYNNMKAESEIQNPTFISEPLPKAEYENTCTDSYNCAKGYNKFPLFPGGLDSDMSSEYGSDSGLFELCPVLDIQQSSRTCPCAMDNRDKMIEEEFGDIDDEMLEAITDLEKRTAAECIKNNWDSDSDMDGASIFDDYPMIENPTENKHQRIQYESKGQSSPLRLPPVTVHKPALQEKLSTDDIVQSQNQLLLIPGVGLHMSEICPSEGLPTSSEPGNVIEENFSTPSDVQFDLNDYSQEQEIFDMSLQRSTPLEDFVEVSEYLQNITSDICASEAEMRKSGDDLDTLSDTNDIWKLLSGLETFSCEEDEGVPDTEDEEGAKEKQDNEEVDVYVDVVEVKKGVEIEDETEGEGGEGESEDESTLYMSKKRKAKGKSKSVRAIREWKPSKKRKIRVVDPSQLKISDYINFHKPPVRPRYDEEGNLNPFVRPPFLPMVPEDPSVPAISARLSVKTCFRIGEALKVGRMITNRSFAGDVLVELYGEVPVIARVGFSERIDLRQNFRFIDIFHEKPPLLNGFYELAVEHRAWEETSAVFLGDAGKGKMARVVGRMQPRIGSEGVTTFSIKISSISETDLDSVDLTRRIICGDGTV